MWLELGKAGVEGEVEEKKLDLVYPPFRAGSCSHRFPSCCSCSHNFQNCCSTHTPHEDHSSVASYMISSEELFGELVGGAGQGGTEGYRFAATQVGSGAEPHVSALGPCGLVRC